MLINNGKIDLHLGIIQNPIMADDFCYVLKQAFNMNDISHMDYNTEFGKNPNYETYGAACDGRLIGISQIQLCEEYAILKWLAVINGYRSYKVGTTLMAETIAGLMATHKNVQSLFVECSKRAHAETYFPTFGFVPFDGRVKELTSGNKKMILDLGLYK